VAAQGDRLVGAAPPALLALPAAAQIEQPWSLAFLPDGRMLVTEKAGRFRFVGKEFKLDPEPISGLPQVTARGLARRGRDLGPAGRNWRAIPGVLAGSNFANCAQHVPRNSVMCVKEDVDMLLWLRHAMTHGAAPEKGYAAEVLYSGWVDLPVELRAPGRDTVAPCPGQPAASWLARWRSRSQRSKSTTPRNMRFA
jgi:hypothetical protein